jgi:hypothetical protein
VSVIKAWVLDWVCVIKAASKSTQFLLKWAKLQSEFSNPISLKIRLARGASPICMLVCTNHEDCSLLLTQHSSGVSEAYLNVIHI